MTDVYTVKQGEIAGFSYTSANLAQLPVALATFGNNIIESLSKSLGALNPIYAKDPRIQNKINIIDFSRGAPELGEVAFRERVVPATYNYLERKFKNDCEEIFIIKIDPCGALDDLNSWNSIWIVDRVRLNNISVEALQAFDASNAVEMTGSFNSVTFERILPIRFALYAESTVLAEVLDGVYYDNKSCGDCSVYSEGCDKLAVLTRANTGSPGLSSQLVFTTTGGSTWTASDIQSLGGKDGRQLTAVGIYLVVVSETDGAHHYAPKSNPVAGQWTRVSTGYAVGGSPRAIYAKSPTEIFIGGQGGYVYKSTDITSSVTAITDGSLTAQNSNDIHGAGQVIVSAHDNNVILYSINNGTSFASLTGPEVGVNLLCVWCKTPYQWYVGTNTGKLWYTMDQGATWTQRALPAQSTLTAVYDIKFSADIAEVGAIAVQATGAGYVYRTITGGRTWYNDAPGIDDLATNEKANFVALCGVNQIASGGKKQSSTDGFIAIAK